jgi:hypothetical protein
MVIPRIVDSCFYFVDFLLSTLYYSVFDYLVERELLLSGNSYATIMSQNTTTLAK